MKILILEPQDDEEEQVIFKCRSMTPELLRIIARLKSQDTLIAYSGSDIVRVSPGTIYYVESVDNKTFLCLKEKVLESRQKLYELEDALSSYEFLRASKSLIVNMSKIKTLSPALNGRFEAQMENGEKVIISRQYVTDLKKRLGI